MMRVCGDKKRLVQVVANILNNAAKYTPEGGNIVLRVEVLAAHVAIEIADNGIGMERDLALRSFDLFAQAERTPDRSSGGLGLGLALVKNLVELHGGRASCHSAGLGRGSTFAVHLPRMVDSKFEPDRHKNLDRDMNLDAQPLQILVVDDNQDAASMIALLLEASGHQVFVENSSRRALERARQQALHVCILDIGLPEMNGLELAKRLRAQPETANASLIAVTGYGQEDDRAQTRAAGFNYHLVKPVNVTELLDLLAQVKTS